MNHETHNAPPLGPALSIAVVEQMDEGICLIDRAGRIYYVNAAAVALLGKPAGELQGELLCDEVLESGEGTAALRRALGRQEVLRGSEATVTPSQGVKRPLALDVWPLEAAAAAPTMAVQLRDISRRRGTERQLRRRVDELQAIVSDAPLGIFILTLEGEITFGNQACSDIFGISTESLIGEWLPDMLVAEDRPVVTSLLHHLARDSAHRIQHECRWQRPNGTALWGNLTASLLRQADGSPRLLLAIIEDINPRKEVQAELQEVKRRLARSRELVQQKLARDLHDGPIQDLYAAQFQLQALDRVVQSESGQSLLKTTGEILKEVSNRLRGIMGELRPPALAPFGLPAALHSLIDQFEERYPTLQVGREFNAEEDTLPEHARLTVYRIAQEMLNNVAQHADARHVLVRFKLNEELLLEVQDDGAGFNVPERWIELARENHLGLVGISERAEEIDGQLTILSAPQQGTIVRVVAPRPTEEKHE